MRRLSLAALLILGVWLPGHPASAYTITLNSFGTSNMMTYATDQSGGTVSEIVYPAALPYSNTSSSVDGSASAVSEYDLSNDGFDITFDLSRAITGGSYGQSFANIRFSVDQAIDFVASGSYFAIDSDGRRVLLRAYVYDYGTGSYVFNSVQESHSTPNESFTLGGTEGDYSNTNTGLLTGTLIAGHDYSFFYEASVHTYPSASTSGATATGFVSLTFAPVPEPSTALLLAFGLVGIAAGRRRRAHRSY